MTTVEKLLVQIFDRKSSIIEQVKQQTELYSQHLASKLLIDEIKPPSWLWNPNASSDSDELNKEELISKLLRPYPQPSARCSVAHYPVYDNLVVTGDNEEFSDGVFMENLALSKCLNRQDYHPTVPQLSGEDRVECVLNTIPEPDASVTSPEDQTDERIVNIYHAPDQSLARIQRSKSRQKALQIRNSGKALFESGKSNEKNRDAFSSQIRFSLSATNQAGQNDEVPKLAEPCVTGSQGCADWDLEKADGRSKEKVKDAYSGRITRSRIDKADSRSKEKMKDASGRITRSRSHAEVPDFVRGSLTLGCPSEDCKDNASSHISEGRRSESITNSDSEEDDNYVNTLLNSAGPSTVHCLSGGDTKVGSADCLNNNNGTNVYAGRISRSNISTKFQSCRRDSSNADISCDDFQRIDNVMMDSRDDLLPDSVDGSLVCPSNVLNEGCVARESFSGDRQSHRERDTVPSWSSSKQNTCVDEVSDLELHSHSPKVDGGVLASLSGNSAHMVNNSKEVHGLVKPSVGLFRRVTRSQSRSNEKEIHVPLAFSENLSLGDTKSKSDSKQKSAANDEIQNTSSGKFSPPCHGTNDMLDECQNASFVMVNELVLHDHVDQSGGNSSCDGKQRRELELEVAPIASDFLVFVEPKQLKFIEVEECNLKAFTSNSAKRRHDNSPEKMSCSLPDPAVSLNKGISCGVNQLSLGKNSSRKSDISSKGQAARRDGFESDMQENPDNQAEDFGPVIIGTVLKNSENKPEAGSNCTNSEVFVEADSVLSKMFEKSEVQIQPTKPHAEDGLEALPMQHMEEGDWSDVGKDKSHLMSSAPGSENLRASRSYSSAKEPRAESSDSLIAKIDMLNQTCVVLDKMKQHPVQECQTFSCLEGGVCGQHEDSPLRDNVFVANGNSSLKRNFRHASVESWPQTKRRKIEHQQTQCFTTSPSFRVRKPHSIQRGLANTDFGKMEVNKGTSMGTFHIDKSIDIEMFPEMSSNLVEGIESTYLSQNGEVGFCYKEKNEHKNSSPVINNEQLGAALVSSLKKESSNSHGRFFKGTSATNSSSNRFDARELGDGQCKQHVCNLETAYQDPESLTLTDVVLEGTQCPNWESGLQAQYAFLSPRIEDLEIIDVDQSMPVLEGFIVDAQPDDGELDFGADGIDLEKLNLPRNTIERASILAEICRSASLDKPSSLFSSAFEFQGAQNLFQSVTNGHLEQLDLTSSFPLDSDVDKQLPSGRHSAGDYKEGFEGMPYPDSLVYSGAPYGWNLRNQHASPVGKLWERLSSHTGSSEKRLSSNPELTCFPIEEDPSISEENKTVDENADDGQEEVDSSLAKLSDKRQPLKDLTNMDLNPLLLVSGNEETLRADSANLRTKLSVTGTKDAVQSSPKNQYRNKSEIREIQTSPIGATDVRKNQTSLRGTNGIKKAKESTDNSISKSLLSNKTSLDRRDQKLSLKESRRNNIISNVSSFIPLVQQKQAAAVCAGKRDVKVKALEAAEAAKRLEEKKANERKMKMEALKLERAKLEEKNLRQLELEKKKKEEERKKKDADIIARKRLREEEEKKEKEKKRMRLETRHRQREQDEKARAGKAEQENRSSKDEQMNRKKEFLNESKKPLNTEIVRGDDIALKKTDTKLTTTKVVMNEECGTSGQPCEAVKAMHAVDKSPRYEDLIVHNSQGKSYEISPYQCSDDEDEEDDELPNKKYIPSWASKSSVAMPLPLQQEMNPDTIFPPESFCSMEEVLLPRKLQQKQVDA